MGVDHKRRPVTCHSVDPDGLRYEFRVGEIEPLNPDVSLILGDAYHNLRSALDALVFQLHVKRHRGSVPPKVIEELSFPIRESERRFGNGRRKGQSIPSDEWNEIRTLARRQRQAIEWLQPYKGYEKRWPLSSALRLVS